jgi:hypothetical protein
VPKIFADLRSQFALTSNPRHFYSGMYYPEPTRERQQPVTRKPKQKTAQTVGLIGVGFDNGDGHKRITKGEEFVLVGGSQETHERMQDVAIHVTEALQNKGKRLGDAEVQEVIDLIHNALDR